MKKQLNKSRRLIRKSRRQRKKKLKLSRKLILILIKPLTRLKRILMIVNRNWPKNIGKSLPKSSRKRNPNLQSLS